MSEIRSRLLSALLSRQGDYVSGGDLARELSVSRVAIKNHVDHLIADGLQIEAVRNRGYSLVNAPEFMHCDVFAHYLSVNGVDDTWLQSFDELDSTNMELDRRLNLGDDAPMIVIAKTQSKGKGRRGNAWKSLSGNNLYLSLGFRPNIPLSRIGQYTLWIGIAVAKMLRDQNVGDVMVKWPNDLYLNGKKIAGILSEAKIDTDHVQHLIVGIGLNINTDLGFFEGELETKGTSLAIENEATFDFNYVGAEVTKTIIEASETYFTSPQTDEIQRLWGEYDFLKGKMVTARAISGNVIGMVAGIDALGELQIRSEDGEIHTVNSGEVTMAFEERKE